MAKFEFEPSEATASTGFLVPWQTEHQRSVYINTYQKAATIKRRIIAIRPFDYRTQLKKIERKIFPRENSKELKLT